MYIRKTISGYAIVQSLGDGYSKTLDFKDLNELLKLKKLIEKTLKKDRWDRNELGRW